jgi:hypothetical protein
VSKHYNEKWVNCKHQDAVILAGTCKKCNKERAKLLAPGVKVRFKEGYHHGLGMYISTERQLYTEASKADGTVRWS